MRLALWGGVVLYVAVNVVAIRVMWLSDRNHAPGVDDLGGASGLFGLRARGDRYTERGWRLRQRAIQLHLAAFVIGAIALLISMLLR